ncbi:MAG TPA: hypothetical protein PKW90_16520, partial [Myxococcota bacterium]|nr:hypothetical protein [Myxococcota bacterium]
MAHWLSRSDLPGPSDNPAELLHYARTGEGWPPGLPPPGRSLRDQHPPDSLVDPEVAALPAPIWRHLRRRCRVDRVHTGWWDVPETPGLRFDGELVAWGQASGGPRLAWTPEKKWLPNHSLTSLTESLPESPPWDEGPGLLLEHIAALLEELEAPAAEKAAFYNLFWLSAISPTMRVRKTVLPGNLLPLFPSTAFSVLPTRLQAALLAMNHILG